MRHFRQRRFCQHLPLLIAFHLASAYTATAAVGLSREILGVAARHHAGRSIRGVQSQLELERLTLQGRRLMQKSEYTDSSGNSDPEPRAFSSEASKSQPELAAAYVDSLLADPANARDKLCRNFKKRSKIAVMYMCFERMEMIQRAVPAIVRSEGFSTFDFFISQDGSSASIYAKGLSVILQGAPYTYIHHPANLCAGLHHFFVKAFAFDIMGYETLLVVEEDNVVHPQALQLLARMVELSIPEPNIGVVSLLDMDMSAFLDANRFGAGITSTAGPIGHLWVFGLHRSKYEPARGCLYDYFHVIKGHDYRMKHEPPLRDAIEALMREKGFPMPNELSQDRWFINSLAKYGFNRRYQTLFRFFEPIGHYGLHFNLTEAKFYSIFGHRMFDGRINPAAAFDVNKDPRHLEAIRQGVAERLEGLRSHFWGNVPLPHDQVNRTVSQLLEGELNGLEMVQVMMAGP